MHLNPENVDEICDFAWEGNMIDVPTSAITLVDNPTVEMPESGIVSVASDFLSLFFSWAARMPGPYVLVTIRGDQAVTQVQYETRPKNIVYWFAKNAVACGNQIEGLPGGLANNYHPHGRFEVITDSIAKPPDITNLVHCCFALDTNIDERVAAWRAVYKALWSTTNVFTSHQAHPLSYEQYISDMHKHVMTVSPEGNGIDCHRTWEAMYLGLVPIVKRSPAMSWFTNYPIIFVDSWPQVKDLDWLLHERRRVLERPFDRAKLYTNYWRDRFQQVYRERT